MPASFTPAHRGGSGPPLVCLHGFTDTWRSWELVLAELERHHDVLAPTLPGHAGGPPVEGELSWSTLLDEMERMMDDAGFTTAHLVGNSLGGLLALQLAARGRADSVVAFAPAGGWAEGDDSYLSLLSSQAEMHRELRDSAPHAHALLSTDEGRRRAAQLIASSHAHIPVDLLADQLLGAAICDVAPFLECASRKGYDLDAAAISCRVRVVWGTHDRLLPWPSAAVRFQEAWLPNADWVVLDGVGHCPQLDVPLEAAQLVVGFTDP